MGDSTETPSETERVKEMRSFENSTFGIGIILACLVAQGCGKDACEDQAAEAQVDIQLSGIAQASVTKTVVTIRVNNGKEMTKTFHKAQPSFVFNLDYPEYNSAPYSFWVRAIAYNKAKKELGYGEVLNNFSFNGCNHITVTVQARLAKDAGVDVGLDASPKDSAPDKSRQDLPVKDIAVADKAVHDKKPLMDMPPSEAIHDGPVVDLQIVDKSVVLDKPVPDAPVPDQIQPDYPVPDLPLPDMPLPADLHVPDQMLPDLPPPPDAGPVVPMFPVAVAGVKSNTINGVDVDASGNIYITGCWGGTATLAGKTLIAKGDNDMFTAKLSPSGALVWVATAGGTGWTCGEDIAVDWAGNVHVSGRFRGTATFGSFTHTKVSHREVFVAKLNPTGKYNWVFTAKGKNWESGEEIALGPQGSVYVAGYFEDSLTFGSTTLQSKGSKDVFVAKLNSSGGLNWVISAGDVNSDELGGLAVDESGNAYITGWFSGKMTLGSFVLSGQSDLFVARLSKGGKFQWAKSAGGVGSGQGRAITVDSVGNSYVTGTFGGNATFGTLTLKGDGSDLFVSKLDSSGKFTWAVGFKGSGWEYGRAIRLNRAGQIVIGGHFGYYAKGPGETLTLGTQVLTSKGKVDAFMALLDPQGKALWASGGGGPDLEYLHGLAIGPTGSVFSCGSFKLTGTFGNKTLVSQGGEDGFLWKEPPSSKWCGSPKPAKSCSGGWCKVKAGCFYMGSPPTEPCREKNAAIKETQHAVTLSKDFVMWDQEVTQGQYQALMGSNPAHFSSCGTSCPVEKVTWHMAAAYCNALSAKELRGPCYACSGTGASTQCAQKSAYHLDKVYTCGGYRLPTEAEWEYAYRASTTTAYYNGPISAAACSAPHTDPNANKICWYYGNASGKTHAGKGKQPNALGLYDLPGNVLEWSNDWHVADLGSAPVTDPGGTKTGTKKTVKGGAAANVAPSMRAAFRLATLPTQQSPWYGFRCVRSVQAWDLMTTPTTENLRDVWGTSDTNVYAVGTNGTILHFDGKNWKLQPSGVTWPLGGVWGSSSSNVYAVGHMDSSVLPHKMTLLRNSGAGWKHVQTGVPAMNLSGIHGIGPNNIVITAEGARILKYNGKTWTMEKTSASSWLTDAWVYGAPMNFFVVGYNGSLLQHHASKWTSHNAGTSAGLSSIWGTSLQNVYATGGSIYRYDGQSWKTETSSLKLKGYSIHGNSPTNIYASTVNGIVYHYDGKQWTKEYTGTTQTLYSVWVSPSGTVFAVGNKGAITRMQ